MKTLHYKILLGVLLFSGIISLSVACSAKKTQITTPVTSSPASIQNVADPIARNILTALNNNDYAAFSKNLSQKVKNIITQKSFDQLYNRIKTADGDYQSVQFVRETNQNGAFSILYVAHFSNEPAGVVMNLVLQSNNGTYQVEGLNFNSPNLAGQPIDLDKLKEYADPATENALVSLNNNDYAGFTRDFNQVMKNAIPQTAFDKLHNKIKSVVGDYQSKKFESASMQNNITTVIYLAQYTNEPAGVWVTISFDSNQKIAGLILSSPKLQQTQ